MTEIIKGSGGGKGGGGTTRVAIEDENTLQSIQYAKVLDLISEGEIEGLVDGHKSIYLDDTPLQNADGTYNYSGFTFVERRGLPHSLQDHISGFDGVESTQAVGLQVKQVVPITQHISESNTDKAVVTISIPRLTLQDKTNGDLHGTSVSFKIEQSPDGGAYVGHNINTLATSENYNSTGASTSVVTVNNNTPCTGMVFNISWNRSIIDTIYRLYRDKHSHASWKSVNVYGGSFMTVKVEYKRSIDPTYTVLGTYTLTAQSADSTRAVITKGIELTGLENTTYDVKLTVIDTEVVRTPIYNWIDDGDGQGGPGYYRFYGTTVEAVPTIDFTGLRSTILQSTLTITGKTTSTYKKDYIVDLIPASSWDIKVTRLTADNDDQSELSDDIYFDALTRVIDAKLTYPHSALIGVSIDASQFNNIPTRGYDVRLLKIEIPTNYDPLNRTYTGAWDGTFQTAWSDNPAWCFRDLIVNNRYGLGQYISPTQVDKWELYKLAKYCDELVPTGFGGMEPRLTFNAYLQTKEEAYTVLNNLASIFKGMIFWNDNKLSVVYDSPGTPVAIYNNANVVEGTFNYVGTSIKARHNTVLVTWNDPLANYKPKVEYVEDSTDVATRGIVQKEITAIGTTSKGQANRLGRWIIFAEKYETEIVTFKSSLENLGTHPGDVIEVYDRYKAGVRYSGRIVSSTLTSITIDESIFLQNGIEYSINILTPKSYTEEQGDDPSNLKDSFLGTIENRVLTNLSGNATVLTFATPLTTLNQDYVNSSDYFADDYVGILSVNLPKDLSLWAVYEDTLAAQQFKVLSIIEEEDNLYEISAVEHNPYKYQYVESLRDLDFVETGSIGNVNGLVSNIVLEEELYFSGPVIKNRVSIGWSASIISNIISKYRVEYRKDDDNWKLVGETTNQSIEIEDATPGSYLVRVSVIGSTGIVSQPLTATAPTEILGKTAPPADIVYAVTTITDGSITLAWAPVSDIDLDFYRIKYSATTDWATATMLAEERTLRTTFAGWGPSTLNLLIKAVDTSGNESQSAYVVPVTITEPSTPILSSSFSGQNSTLSWTCTKGSYNIVRYEIREGNSDWDLATFLANVDSTNYTESMVWTSKTYVIKAVDAAGNYSPAANITVNNSIPTDVSNLALTVSENVINISWDNVTDGDLDFYTIKIGTDWSTGLLVDNIKANTHVLNGYLGTSLDVMVKAVDIAGLESTNEATANLPITKPGTPILNYEFNGPDIIIDWSSVENTFEISYYELRYGGSDWATSTFIAYMDADNYTEKVSWVSKTYRVKAYDTSGNTSLEGSTTPNINFPATNSLTSQVIDNNVLLYWSITNGTLPIDTIELRRGTTFATAAVIGEKSGTFTVVFEPLGGQYKYWIVPIDTAGNVGTELSVTSTVNEPPDYVLRQTWISTFNDTLNNLILESGKLVGPVNTTETYQQHFVNNTWDQPQDQVDAGYPYYIEPVPATAYYEETFDYGIILPGTKITVDMDGTDIHGTTTVTPTVSVSTDDISYTDYNVWEVVATNFRYVKVKVALTTTGGNDVYNINGLTVRLDVKLKTDAANGTAVSTDVGGTSVTFGVSFLDVNSIVVTPKGTTSVNAVYDFTDVPNPTTFYVYLFDNNGTRVSGDFSWTARGY